MACLQFPDVANNHRVVLCAVLLSYSSLDIGVGLFQHVRTSALVVGLLGSKMCTCRRPDLSMKPADNL